MYRLILTLTLLILSLILLWAAGIVFMVNGYTPAVSRICLVAAITSFLGYISYPKGNDNDSHTE